MVPCQRSSNFIDDFEAIDEEDSVDAESQATMRSKASRGDNRMQQSRESDDISEHKDGVVIAPLATHSS